MTPERRRTGAGGALVLIIDDVRPLAEQYAYDLERLGGFRTRVAASGERGLEILTREVVDCVILDLEMPGLDGFDVLRAVQHREIDVPVIVYTGTGSFDRCVEAVRLGAFSFVDKAESMERVVSRGAAGAQADRPAAEAGRTRGPRRARVAPDRRERAHARPARGDCAAGRHTQPRAGPGRERDGQGAGRAGAAPPGRPSRRGVRGGQLRGHGRGPGRQRPLRPRPRRVHGRAQGPAGRLRARDLGHPLPGRDRRASGVGAGASAARPGGRRDHPPGRRGPDRGGRPHRRRDPPRPGRRRRPGHVPPGSPSTASTCTSSACPRCAPARTTSRSWQPTSPGRFPRSWAAPRAP